MEIYKWARIATSIAVATLLLLFILAMADHFFFDERFRPILTSIGKASLILFFAGVATALVKGAFDKFR